MGLRWGDYGSTVWMVRHLQFSPRGPTVTKTCGGDRRGYHASDLGARAATASKGVIESPMHGSSSVGATWPKPSRHSGSSRCVAAVIFPLPNSASIQAPVWGSQLGRRNIDQGRLPRHRHHRHPGAACQFTGPAGDSGRSVTRFRGVPCRFLQIIFTLPSC